MTLLVLFELSEQDRTGYDLIKRLSHGRDSLSAGRVYPLLHDLYSRGVLEVRTEGRRKIYSLTREGKRFLRDLTGRQERMLHALMSQLEQVSAKDDIERFHQMHRQAYEYKRQMLKDIDVLAPLQEAIIRVYARNDDAKQKRLRSTIEKATLQVRRIADG